MYLQLAIDSRDTFQVALSGGDVERRVSVHVHWGEGAASVQHQLGYIHAPRIRCPVETHIQLLEGKRGLFKVITWNISIQLHLFCLC